MSRSDKCHFLALLYAILGASCQGWFSNFCFIMAAAYIVASIVADFFKE